MTTQIKGITETEEMINLTRMNKSIAIDEQIADLRSIQEKMADEAIAEKAEILIQNGFASDKVALMSDAKVLDAYQALIDGKRDSISASRTITITGIILLLGASLGFTSCATSGESVHSIYNEHGYCNETTCTIRSQGIYTTKCPSKGKMEYQQTFDAKK
jgi:hypothetical protein